MYLISLIMDNIKIKPYKWNKKDNKVLFKSCKLLDMKECQVYHPIYSLYFHVHNTKNSHKLMDINRKFYVKELISLVNEKYHTSNCHVKCKVLNNISNEIKDETLFCKCIPLLDPLSFMMNNYNNIVHRNHLLPSGYSYNTFHKINDMNNTAYIDTFFSLIVSELTINNISPSFPIFYGSINGIKGKFNYDITEDYSNLNREEWFYKNLGKTYSIDMYVSDSESDSNSDSETDSDSSSTSKSNSIISQKIYGDDYIASLKKIPCQIFFIEKLEGTLEDLLTENIDELNTDIIISCIFQVSFALTYLQKNFNFTHNDLHINNVMYNMTDKKFLYYKINNKYFKIPTHGYIFKIIDFGRAIFSFHNKLFFNDTFDKHGEAEGQYSYPIEHLLFKDKEEKIEPNYNFDLCRLAITIIDKCRLCNNKDYREKQQFVDFIYNLTISIHEKYLSELKDNFDMYIAIAKEANNAVPKDVIQNYIFNKFRIKKKNFPKKLYYKLD